jgi:hypothetical protein
MRRSTGSTSCLLLPKDNGTGTVAEDNNVESLAMANGDAIATQSRATSPLSVTIICQNNLPSYSSERFYLLSELEVHASPTVFLSRLHPSDDLSTQATEVESVNDENDNHSDVGFGIVTTPQQQVLSATSPSENPLSSASHTSNRSPPLSTSNLNTNTTLSSTSDTPTTSTNTTKFPTFILLYLLWKPDMTSDAQIFTNCYILEAIAQIQQYVGLIPSNQRLFASNGNRTSINHTTETDILQSQRPFASLYIVVDRIVPTKQSTTSDESSSLDDLEQQRLVHTLCRHVASHPTLRHCIDGITIGMSNHVRAAPGLELCIDAITKIGHIERRRFCSTTITGSKFNGIPRNYSGRTGKNTTQQVHDDSKKSLLGIVTMVPEDLLGLQEIHVTDAVDGIQQCNVTAEWYGRGDIFMFASRAHDIWKQQHGIIVSSHEHSTKNGNNMHDDHHDGLLLRKRKLPRSISTQTPNRREIIILSSNNTIQHRHRNRLTLQQERELLEEMYDMMGYIFIFTFIVFHFIGLQALINTIHTLFFRFSYELWIDFIRSARGWW